MTTPTTIWVFGDIGCDVASQPIIEQLAANPDADVLVRLNSAGGSVTEASAIFNALRAHRGAVRVHIDGLAASAGSYIAMAGDVVEMAENALMMIHSPLVANGGNAKDLRESAELLDKIALSMQRAYAAKSGLSAGRITQIMAAETWYTAEEAKAAGFADVVTGALDVAAKVDPGAFTNLPTHVHARLLAMTHENTGGKSAGDQPRAEVAAKATAVDEFKAQENERRREIRGAFRFYREHHGVAALEQRCVDDMNCNADAARNRLLSKLGEGAEPLGHAMRMGDFEPTMGMGGYIGGMSDRQDAFTAAACDGVLMRYGVPVTKPHPAAKDFVGASVRDLAAACLSRAGKTLAREGADSMIRAALTTSDFPALLENVAQKALIVGLESDGATTHRDTWTKRGSVADFKKASRVALSEAPDLEQLDEGGEITQGGLTDAGKETIQVETYARIVSISRKALVNDDLGELTRVPQSMGLAAARKESDLVYQLLADSPVMRDGNPLFDASHANLSANAAPITIASLSEARSAMRKQRGVAQKSYLNVTPYYLVVGADRETQALQIIAQIQPNMVSSAIPDWIRQLTVVVDPRVDDFADGAWFVAGNPRAHDTFEVAFLDGQSVPNLQQHEDFGTLNMCWRVVMDMGVAALDWRALYKNPGA